MYERMKALYALSMGLSERRRYSDAQQVYVRRRRAWLWRPLAAVGAALLVWQVTSFDPIPPLVILGIALCIPWMVDV